ncbi:MAG: cytochrome c oxidase assembly protein [Candidatus Actinomarina sp.]
MQSLPFHPHYDIWTLIISLIIFFEFSTKNKLLKAQKRKIWYSGVIILWIFTDYPLHDIGEKYLFSVHSVEHLVLALVSPPLLLLGMHSEMKKLISVPLLIKTLKISSKPVVAFFLFNTVMVGMHWTNVVNLMVTNTVFHFFVHSIMLLISLNMWIPVIGFNDEIKSLSQAGKIGYMFLQSLLPTIPASFLTFGTEPIYSAYLLRENIFNVSIVNDQTLAGLVLKLGGGVIIWLTILIIWLNWYKEEKTFDDVVRNNSVDYN